MQDDSNIPFGYCHCGCGGKTKIATKTDRREGWIKGQPQRFVRYHNGRFVGIDQKTKCTVDGCKERPRSTYADYCAKHYHRIHRIGTLKTKQPKGRIGHSNGYELVYLHNHPLFKQGYQYEHRVVFYDAHGRGPFYCHWCNKQVGWNDGREFHIDHLNENKTDNRTENLVPSCALCNRQRGKEKIIQSHRDRFGIEFQGVKKTTGEWARSIGISRSALRSRLDSGWPLEKALTEPRGVTGPRPRR